MVDKFKLTLAALLVAGALAGFYYFENESLLLRVLGLLAVIVAAGGVASQTALGRRTFSFFQEANTEVRKVVWPSRKETGQTTLMVFGMVILVAIFLWALDTFLLWTVKQLTGRGG